MEVDFYKSKVWRKMRKQALIRDNYTCKLCGLGPLTKGLAHVDHIRSRRKYPALALTLSNLQTLCLHCHNSHKQRDEKNPDRGADKSGFPLNGSWKDND